MLLGSGLFSLGLVGFGLIDLSQDGNRAFELRLFALQLLEPLPQIMLLGKVGVAGADEVGFVCFVHEIVIKRLPKCRSGQCRLSLCI
jgi:hypothetical protein